MLAVVGGIGYVSGALFAGLLAGGGFSLIVGTFSQLGIDHPVHAETFSILSHLFLVATALIGIGVAKNPSGNFFEIFREQRILSGAPVVRYAAVVATAVLYALAYVDVIGAWTFSVLVLVLWLASPALGRALRPEQVLSPEQRVARRAAPLELIGVDTPYPEAFGEHLDRQLGLPAQHRPTALAPRAASVDAAPSTEEDTAHVSV
jgi:hypothetical protein